MKRSTPSLTVAVRQARLAAFDVRRFEITDDDITTACADRSDAWITRQIVVPGPLVESHLADTSVWSMVRTQPALADWFNAEVRASRIVTCGVVVLDSSAVPTIRIHSGGGPVLDYERELRPAPPGSSSAAAASTPASVP